MCQKFISIVLLNALVLLLCADVSGVSASGEKEAKLATKVKAGVTQLGTGPAARIEVTLKDKTKLKGYIDQIAEDHFVLIDDRTGVATKVPYPQVKHAKGNNLSSGAKFMIAVVIIGIIIAALSSQEP